MQSEEVEPAFNKQILQKEAKYSFIYTVANLITQIGGFILVPIFWRKLTPTDYGIIGVSEVLVSFLGGLWGLSLEISISRFYYEWPREVRKRKLGALWVLSWGSAVVLGALSILFVALVGGFLFPDAAFYPFILLGMTQGIMARMRQLTFYTIRTKQLPWVYLAYSVSIFLVSITANICFVVVLDWGLLGYFIACNLSEAILLIACSVWMLYVSTPCLDRDGLKSSILYALPLVPNNLMASLSSVLDRILLQRFASLEALGIFTICMRFAAIIVLVSDAMKMSFAPFMFKAVSEEGRAAVKKIAHIRMYYLIPIFITGLAVSLFTEDFVYWVNQPKYFPVIRYVPLLVGAMLLVTLYPYFGSGMLLAKRSEMVVVPTFIQLLLTVLGGIILIPSLHMAGIVLSRYVTGVGYFASAVILSQKYFRLPIHWKRLGSLLLILAIGIAIGSSQLAVLGISRLVVHLCCFLGLSTMLVIAVAGCRPRHWLQSWDPSPEETKHD